MTEIMTLPDGALAYGDEGDGPAVVLLHGGALDHHMWDPQLPALAARARAVRPDARGCGRSSTPTGPFRHCDDVAALIEHLGVAPATLVGLSMGARTALDTALEHPRLVERVVISGAGAGEPVFRDPFALAVLEECGRAERERDPGRWIEAFLRFAAGPHRELDRVDPDVVSYLRATAADTLAHHVAAGAVVPDWVPDAHERLGEIAVPVRAIDGALDSDDHLAFTRETTARVADGAERALPGCAHYPNLERAAQFDEALLAAGVGAASAG